MTLDRLLIAIGVLGLLGGPGCAHTADGSATPPASPGGGPEPSETTPTPQADDADASATPAPNDAGLPSPADPPADAGTAAAPAPAVNLPDMSAAPAYPASALYETFSSQSARDKLIACYLPGKKRDPKLRGKVSIKFTINANGSAKPAANEGSNLTDDAVIACVVRTIKTLKFQKPLEGSVTVVYPFIFRPTGDDTLILPSAGKK